MEHVGDRIAYGSTRRNGADRDLYVMDPASPSSDHMVLEGGGGWGVLDWSPDDKLLALEGISVNQANLWLVDLASGARTLLAPAAGDTVAFGGGTFSPDGKGIYLTSDQGSEFMQLRYMDLGNKV